jgi:hypothetical protein
MGVCRYLAANVFPRIYARERDSCDEICAVIFRECVHVIETYYARNFGRAMQAMFQTDLQKSKEYTLADFRKRSLWERTIEWLMLPFRSQM